MKPYQINLDFINIIKGLSFSQMFLQDQRATLVNSGYFNDYEVYKRIDTKNTGKIFATDLIDYLGVHRIAASQRQCQYLIWNTGSSQPFLTYQQFQQYLTNGQPHLLDKMQSSSLSRNLSSGDQIIRSTNQRQLSVILQKQIQFYRTIQQLKEQFIKKHGYNFKNVILSIDKQKKGNLMFNIIVKFIHQHGVQFSVEEYQALCKKIRTKQKDVISFKEILKAMSPFQPLNFPTYRKQNNIMKAMQYINSQVQRLNIDTNPFEQNLLSKPSQNQYKPTSTGFQKVVDNFRSTLNNGTSTTNKYFYDKNYYNQLRQYKTAYFDPNKRKYTTSNNQSNQIISPQYHDHFFGQYYMYLDERNKTEHYYNKFGKRYTFEDPINKALTGKI